MPPPPAAAVWKPRRFTLLHAITLEGETKQVLGFAVLVYLLPLVLFFVGYGVGAGMKLGGGLSALIGGVLFIGGILAAMWYSHKLKLRNEAPFAITERL